MSGPVKKIAVRPTSPRQCPSRTTPRPPPRACRAPRPLSLESTADGSPLPRRTNVTRQGEAAKASGLLGNIAKVLPWKMPAPHPARSGRRCPSEPPSTASPPQRESTPPPKSVRVPVRKTLNSRSHPVPPPSLNKQEPAQHGEGPARRARTYLRRRVPHQGLEAQVRARPSRRRVLDHGGDAENIMQNMEDNVKGVFTPGVRHGIRT